jgi:hypothetical protein
MPLLAVINVISRAFSIPGIIILLRFFLVPDWVPVILRKSIILYKAGLLRYR